MADGLEIRVLGDLQVLRDGRPLELPPSRKTRALVAYLAVVGRPQRRERLCEMFWEVPDDPRGALRWSLSKIRGILKSGGEEPLLADRNTVAIDPAAVRSDFAEVEALARAGLDALDTAALRRIADRFRGIFLDDLALPRCPDFDAWRTAHADDMELLRLDTLRRLVDRLRDEPEEALPYAHQLQRLVPDDPGLPRLVAGLAEAARRQSVGRVGAALPAAPAAAPPAPAATATAAPAAATAATEVRFCTTRDGVRVAYAVEGSGPTIVRAAHWMSHLRYEAESPVWSHWMRALSAENTLVRYDERGNGMSAWDVADVGFEAMVADLESIIDASGQKRVVLLGVSQSCAVSVAYAVRHPERVLGLVLYGGYVKGWRARGNPAEIALREAMNTLMREGWGKDDPVFRQLFTSLFIPGATREQMDWFNDLQRRTVTPENAWRLAQAFGDIDVADLLPRVGVPTLVLHAKGDRVSPIESGKQFAAGIRGARFVELDSENHILLESEPAFADFIGHVRRFVAEVTAPRPAAAGGDAKRPLSVLVADIVSPLHAFDTMDPELAEDMLDPLVETVVGVIAGHGGHVVDAREGVVTAAFGADRAAEEHTVRACRAARAIRDAVSRQGAGAVKVRIGIDAGEAVVRGDVPPAGGRITVSGPVLKAAARVAGALRRDTIALTARARESAGGFVSAVRMPRSECPGLARDEIVHELLAENRALSRWHLRARQGLTPLVGRSEEFEALSACWRRAREGEGGVVAVIGSPGVGKSRITHEFVGSDELKGFTLLEAGAQEIEEAVSHGLVKRVLLSLFGLEGGEDDAAVLRTVRRRFAALGVEAALLPPVLYLLDQPVEDPAWRSVQGPDRARRLREAFTALLVREAEARPVCLLVEDLHWADAESVKVLEALTAAAGRHRILVILTHRPGFQPPWAGATPIVTRRLQPLGADQSRDLVAAILGDDASVADLADLISERAEGVPLFAEEIVGALVQSERLVGRPGSLVAPQPVSRLDIPASVQSVIAARVDKLELLDRNLLQIASAVGTAAPRSLLEELSGLGPVFDASFARLQGAELMLEGRSGPDPELQFKHALIREVTYASLPADRRRQLHGRILSALERVQPGRQGDQVERLAHHALRAERWDDAVRHLVAAADRAVERSAYPAAAGFLEQAVAALARLPDTVAALETAIDVRTRMRIAYMVTGDFDKAIARLVEAQELSRRLDDPGRLAYTLLHTSYVYSTYGRVEQALAVAEEARAIGLLAGDERTVAEADLAAAQAHMIRGEAAASLKRLLPHVTDFVHRWADDRLGFLVTRSVWFLGSIASCRALLGAAAEAEADIADALRHAAATGRPIDAYAAAYFESLVRLVHGPDAAFLERLAAVTAECRERAPFPFHPWLTATLGHALLAADRRAEAVAALDAAFEAAELANMPHFVTYAAALRAAAAATPGDEASREDLEDALRTARESGDRWIEVEVLSALAGIEEQPRRAARLAEAMAVAEAAGYAPFAARIGALAADRAETAPLRAAGG